MESILNQLYYGQINESERSYEIINKSHRMPDEELKKYQEIYDTLTEEQKKLFDSWLEEYIQRNGKYAEEIFHRAFKIGFHLAIEIYNFEL